LKYDVVVIGAGVAGLNAAYVLASMGYRVAIVESKPRSRIGDKTCGDAIGVHHFEELGWSPPDSVIDHVYDGVKIYSPSEKYSLVVPGKGVSVNRVKFGQWLLKRAEDHGAELLDKHVLVGVSYNDNGVRSVKVKEIGRSGYKELFAEAFIDASGAKPALRSKLPLEWPIAERPYMTDYNIAYREVLEIEKPVPEEDRRYAVIYLNTEIAPGGYWWLFPKDPSGRIINIGLGVIWGVNNYNPRHNYDKYLRPRFKGRLIHAGGGMVPTRRPLPTLVWRNVGTAGDAAYTVNPVHGGGIGSSLQAAAIVAKHIGLALEKGPMDESATWDANREYMRVYGAKQASLDILRMYLQKLSNDDFEWILKNRIVDGKSIYDLGTKADIVDEVVHGVSRMIKLLSKPSLLNQLRIVRSYMNKVKKLYLEEYPDKPEKLSKWMEKVDKVFDEYRSIIKYDPGLKVKW
jgi:digeranylgeranylglycerophospholipid reductase